MSARGVRRVSEGKKETGRCFKSQMLETLADVRDVV